ncbi:MAG TPA: 1,2-phenylacetyl-CoA epoxidase subunit PaaE [Chitinophagaceae bacterium]|nr:1,2-phenylacetyl-CoA epoxidase subunit PaaE [Chitinophagaceae bacterium]
MSLHFHRLPVRSIRRETPDCVSIVLAVPPELREVFSFTAGQNLTLRARVDGQDIRRSYSICSAPGDGELRVAVKRVPGGIFSGYANDRLRPGDYLEVLPPTGQFFTALHQEHQKKYLAFAAGSGITPVISIIKSTFTTEPRSTFTLVYGNRTISSVIFLEELEGLKNKYLDRFQLIYLFSRESTDTPLNNGRLDGNKLLELGRILDYAGFDAFFLCGPQDMIFGTQEFLKKAGIDERKIHFELFTVPGKQPAQDPLAEAGGQPGTNSRVTVRIDGRSFDLDLDREAEPILDAALKKGADLPFACKGGVCGTCRARVLEGEVTMEVNWALEPEEVARGYILTCQSHPKTPKVVVDFD